MIETFETSVHAITARSSRDRIEVCKSSRAHGFGVRVIKDGAIGFSFYSKESEKEHAIKRAMQSASLSPKEHYALPQPLKPTKVKQYDSELAHMEEEGVIELLIDTINGASEEAEPSKGEVSVGIATTHVSNSNGIDVSQKDTILSAYVSAKKEEAIGYEYFAKKKIEQDLTPLGKEAGHWASHSAGGKPINFQGQIIISVETISNFFETCVLRNLNGENLRRKKSLWKQDDVVMHPNFSLKEDPTIPWTAGAVSTDDEGLPTQKKTLIEHGIVKKILYDTRTANLVATKSTGNGFRAGFNTVPLITSTNLILSTDKPTDIFDVKKGVYVKELMGFHNMNPITGDFSLDIVQGFTVKNGELDRPIKGCMLVGNFLDALKTARLGKQEQGKTYFFSPEMQFDGKVIHK
ncbi:TldD/PmbA family protein [archaeon]|nr:TldD/PmbA family protein [archaeon]